MIAPRVAVPNHNVRYTYISQQVLVVYNKKEDHRGDKRPPWVAFTNPPQAIYGACKCPPSTMPWKSNNKPSKIAIHHQGRKNLDSIKKNPLLGALFGALSEMLGGRRAGGAPREGAEGVGRRIMIMIVFHESRSCIVIHDHVTRYMAMYHDT